MIFLYFLRRDSELNVMFKLFQILGRQYVGKCFSAFFFGTSRINFLVLFSPRKGVKKSLKEEGHFLLKYLYMKKDDWYSIKSWNFNNSNHLKRGFCVISSFFACYMTNTFLLKNMDGFKFALFNWSPAGEAIFQMRFKKGVVYVLFYACRK